mmetsp:Transcript_174612/g.559817  ORF Transcript_174612/g.559817 Transcript_174612/m.559817 type:complete len:246 (+) Transcript_174612:956-1693(+)
MLQGQAGAPKNLQHDHSVGPDGLGRPGERGGILSQSHVYYVAVCLEPLRDVPQGRATDAQGPAHETSVGSQLASRVGERTGSKPQRLEDEVGLGPQRGRHEIDASCMLLHRFQGEGRRAPQLLGRVCQRRRPAADGAQHEGGVRAQRRSGAAEGPRRDLHGSQHEGLVAFQGGRRVLKCGVVLPERGQHEVFILPPPMVRKATQQARTPLRSREQELSIVADGRWEVLKSRGAATVDRLKEEAAV